MSDKSKHRTSAEIDEEIDARREELEETLDEIGHRLSPGELIDQVIHYASQSIGKDLAHGLGQSLKSNPIPAALIGTGIAWMVIEQASHTDEGSRGKPGERRRATPDVPSQARRGAVKIRGGLLKRTRIAEDEAGNAFWEFADEAGTRFRAYVDEKGQRISDFTDDSGRRISHFLDKDGKAIGRFVDETGSDVAGGWADEGWQ